MSAYNMPLLVSDILHNKLRKNVISINTAVTYLALIDLVYLN